MQIVRNCNTQLLRVTTVLSYIRVVILVILVLRMSSQGLELKGSTYEHYRSKSSARCIMNSIMQHSHSCTLVKRSGEFRTQNFLVEGNIRGPARPPRRGIFCILVQETTCCRVLFYVRMAQHLLLRLRLLQPLLLALPHNDPIIPKIMIKKSHPVP